MEMSGQDNEMEMPCSFSYNNKLNGDSSLLKVLSSAPINPPRTLDYHTEPNPDHQIDNLSRDFDPDLDPDPVSAPSPALRRPAISSTRLIRYRECLKNHAASKGGQVFDGCGEFMPSGEDGTQEALKCAACECHRNFHRKEINGESQYPTTSNPYENNTRRDSTNVHPQQPTPIRQQSQYPCLPIAPVNAMMNFGGGPTDSWSKDLNMFDSNAGKKRFRTKFSQDQKDKMVQFAEKLGWRIQKQDEQEVQQFCGEVGVKRRVLKVWMHNSKQAMKRK